MPENRISSVADLLAHSLAIETEAAERYAMLADQMEVHNNTEVAELFRKLEQIEGKHIQHVRDLSEGVGLPAIEPGKFQWGLEESPEASDQDRTHYLMTPWHALNIALAGERRAVSFFSEIAESTEHDEVRGMAVQLADEEREHVVLIERWLSRYPEPEAGWDEDPDMPLSHE